MLANTAADTHAASNLVDNWIFCILLISEHDQRENVGLGNIIKSPIGKGIIHHQVDTRLNILSLVIGIAWQTSSQHNMYEHLQGPVNLVVLQRAICLADALSCFGVTTEYSIKPAGHLGQVEMLPWPVAI